MFYNKNARSRSHTFFKSVLFALSGLCIMITVLLVLLFFTNTKHNFTNNNHSYAFYKVFYKKNAHIAELAYATIQNLYAIQNTTKEHEQFEILVLKHVQKYPNDPNNSYYFLLLGTIAKKRNAPEQALIRYIRASQHPPSSAYLYLAEKNSVEESLSNITQLELEPRQNLYYTTLLLQHSQEAKTKAFAYYSMGKDYEKLGLWDLSYEFYNKFLQYQNSKNELQKQSNEKTQEIYLRLARRKEIMTHRIWDNPEKARNAISYTMLRGTSSQLMRLRTPAFFIAQWDDDILEKNIYVPQFKIHAVLKRSNIYMEPLFSPHSTYTRKFWRITGWDRVSEWFFMFQKIYQPDMPFINGSWEWAGIYLGSKNAKSYKKL